MKKTLFLCAVLLPVLFGCDNASVEDEELTSSVMTFETIEEAAGFVVNTPGTEVIRAEQPWAVLWDDAWSITNEDGVKTPPPSIDFNTKMVIAVFWGSGFSGCSNGVQAIETIVQRQGEIVVLVGPLPDLGLCDAIVYPIQMVQIDHSDLPVVFEGEVPGNGG